MFFLSGIPAFLYGVKGIFRRVPDQESPPLVWIFAPVGLVLALWLGFIGIGAANRLYIK
jgi:hypothetical protein